MSLILCVGAAARWCRRSAGMKCAHPQAGVPLLSPRIPLLWVGAFDACDACAGMNFDKKRKERKGMKTIKVRLTFTEGILGTSPGNEDVFRDYVASKAPDAASIEDEVAALGAAEVTEKAKTVFPRNSAGVPFLYDYQIKGFFKDTCGGLRKVTGCHSAKIKAYKKEIDKLIFISPREIPFLEYGEIGECQRPLRASTPQGERVSLAISEEIPAGAKVEFDIVLFADEHEALVREWLDYGCFSGIGQWRNSGKGRFVWEEI